MLQHVDPYLVTGLLFFLSLLAGTVSERTRIPALILFLGIGMLAGVDGPGGLPFDDAPFTNLVGTVALAFILFSGGFATRWEDIRPIVGRGVLLSTAGVMITAVVMAVLISMIPLHRHILWQCFMPQPPGSGADWRGLASILEARTMVSATPLQT